MIFDQQLVRLRAGSKPNRAGGTVPDWSPEAVSRTLIKGLSVQPLAGQESDDGTRNLRTAGLRVLSDPEGDVPDLTDTDRVEYRGRVYAVDGPVGYWPDPDGDDHVELLLTGYEGG